MVLSLRVEVQVLLQECYKNKGSRPDMATVVKIIEMWQPEKW